MHQKEKESTRDCTKHLTALTGHSQLTFPGRNHLHSHLSISQAIFVIKQQTVDVMLLDIHCRTNLKDTDESILIIDLRIIEVGQADVSKPKAFTFSRDIVSYYGGFELSSLVR